MRSLAALLLTFAPCVAAAQTDEDLAREADDRDAARELEAARALREELLSRFPASPLAVRAWRLVAASYHAQALYERAAEAYEQYVTRHPVAAAEPCPSGDEAAGACLSALVALGNAAFFRVGLGQIDAAIADLRTFERLYGNRRRRDTAELTFSVGVLLSREGSPQDAARAWQDWLRRHGAVAGVGRRIEAQAALGEALWRVHQRTAALQAFAEAEREWDAAGEAGIGAAPPAGGGLQAPRQAEDESRIARLLARTAVAQARFYRAEDAREELLARQPPIYRAGPNLRLLDEWIDGELSRYRQAIEQAAESTTRLYERAAELHALPWEVASAARVAEMNAWLGAQPTRARLPLALRGSVALSERYRAALGRGAEAARLRAANALASCLALSTGARWFDEWHERCASMRERADPARFGPPAELRPAPRFEPAEPPEPRPLALDPRDTVAP